LGLKINTLGLEKIRKHLYFSKMLLIDELNFSLLFQKPAGSPVNLQITHINYFNILSCKTCREDPGPTKHLEDFFGIDPRMRMEDQKDIR
jgi:hypothetical protein